LPIIDEQNQKALDALNAEISWYDNEIHWHRCEIQKLMREIERLQDEIHEVMGLKE
jgi:predicted  nucleic acid-binding Zn-ribbon protein